MQAGTLCRCRIVIEIVILILAISVYPESFCVKFQGLSSSSEVQIGSHANYHNYF